MSAVRFERVSKRFTLHHERARTFQEAALNLFQLRRANGTREEFWALRDVSFSLERGRTLGVIGRNGSGKSTLLKLLSGTMRPTSGRVLADGRVFGLLELAAGFHPELSGRENVFLNGTFLGVSRSEMQTRLDGIVAFSELEQFIDTPVKHYSSGMYMRLGFAIAISVDPDILVIDEVLAVGDAAFRQKCFTALAGLKARGKTILFVTHDAAAVRRFCDEALWLDHGRVRGAGDAEAVLKDYLAETTSTHGEAMVFAAKPRDPLSEPRGALALTAVETVDGYGRPERHFRPGEELGVRIRYRLDGAAAGAAVGVGLHRADGLYVWASRTELADAPAAEGAVVCRLGPLPLAAGEYTVSAAAWIRGQAVHRLSSAATFAIRPPQTDQAGLLVLDATWEEGSRPEPLPAAAALDADVSAAQAGRTPALPGQKLRAEEGSVVQGLVPRTALDTAEGSANGVASHAADGETPGEPPPFVFAPGRPEDQLVPEGAFRFRWRPAPRRVTMGQGEDEFLGHGWYPPEDWPPVVRWCGETAAVYLAQDEWTGGVGVAMCRPQHGAEVVTGRVLVGGAVAGTFELASPSIELFTFPLEPVSEPREVEVRIEVNNPLRPEPGAPDQRVLGVAVREVWLE